MNDLTQHYRDLLGLDQSWIVDDVELDFSGSQVVIRVSHARGKLLCPECGQECSSADSASERSRRRLNSLPFATEIRTAVPRCRCGQCSVKPSWFRGPASTRVLRWCSRLLRYECCRLRPTPTRLPRYWGSPVTQPIKSWKRPSNAVCSDAGQNRFRTSVSLKRRSAARGFRKFENHCARILFHCGKLSLLPEPPH